MTRFLALHQSAWRMAGLDSRQSTCRTCIMILPRHLVSAINRTPLALVQKGVELAFGQALRQHPDLFDRLGEHAAKSFGFRPSDLDLGFVVHPSTPAIRVYRAKKMPRVDAAMSGPMLTLLALLEGRIDGDAVFFSRELKVTGDMEAMLALRNGLDNCGFDLPRDLAGLAGPLAFPARRIAEVVRERALAGMA